MLYGLSLPAFLVESRRRIARHVTRATTAMAAMRKLVACGSDSSCEGFVSQKTETYSH